MKEENKIIIYTTNDGAVKVDVPFDGENVWLNRKQMAELFDRDVKTIGKHINNALKEELKDFLVVAKFATTKKYGRREGFSQQVETEYYNLDVILSVGYRVKSARGVEFRRWANSVLKEYILKGVAINKNRLDQLGSVIKIMKRIESSLEAKQVLSVIEKYNSALDLLDDYDHKTIKRPEGRNSVYKLSYEECKKVIDSMKFGDSSELFGKEKDGSFGGSIGNIYQTFGGQDVYPTFEEKAANLLYFLVKNHSFLDGNKRIAAALFLYFLDKNQVLFDGDEKLIQDFTLVALTIMVAESKPEEKEAMVSVIMNCICKK